MTRSRSSGRRPPSLLGATALMLCLLGGAARADPTDDFQVHYQSGLQQYKADNYQDAIREFQAAYTIKQLPRLLLNIGQAHRKLGHARDALGFYEFYLRVESNPKREIKAELETYIKQTREMLDAAERMKAQQAEAELDRKKEHQAEELARQPAGSIEQPALITPAAQVRAAAPEDAPRVRPFLGGSAVTDQVPALGTEVSQRERRPRWRNITGATALAAGLGLSGLGLSALSVNGTCFEACMFDVSRNGVFTFNTQGIGIGLLTAGLVLSAGAVVLIAVPGKRIERAPRVALSSASQERGR